MKVKSLLVVFAFFALFALAACPQDADTSDSVTTFAGEAGVPGNVSGGNVITDGPAAARFNQPQALAIDFYGHLLVGDSGSRTIRRIILPGRGITDAGRVETLVSGSGQSGINGPIRGMTVDSQGNIIVSDHWVHQVKKFDRDGNFIAAYGISGSYGHNDGPGSSALFYGPSNVAADSQDNIYVADTWNNRIRKIDTAGIVSTFAGSAKGYADGLRYQSLFCELVGIAVDRDDNVIVADTWNHCIRFIAQDGNSDMEVPAGHTGMYATHRGSWGFKDGGSAIAKVRLPQFLFYDGYTGDLYFTDNTIPSVRKVTSGRLVSKTPVAGSSNLPDDPDNELSGNPALPDGPIRVQRFVTTVAGFRGISEKGNRFVGHGYKDGSYYEARFNNPKGVVVTRDGTIYVADQDNHVIRRIEKK